MRRGFLIDMDGVIYRGNEPIRGSVEFVRTLLDEEIPFLFLTNNSQRTARDVAARLRRMGLPISEKHVFTSALATAQYLSRQLPKGSAYVIGEGGLLTALHEVGYTIVDQDPDFVVVGEGRTLNLELIENAVRMIERGARLISTNIDPNCPTAAGMRPGCGAFVAMLETATGRKAFSVGKPNPVMFRAARKELGLRTDETIMVGDTMETDILGGVQMGYLTVLVLSGGTNAQDLSNYSYQPDLVVSSISELLHSDIMDEIRATAHDRTKEVRLIESNASQL